MLNGLLDLVVDQQVGATVGDEARELAVGLLDNLKARLASEVIDNRKALMLIESIRADIAVKTATADRIRAEADSIKIDNMLKALRIVAAGAALEFAGDGGQDAAAIATAANEFCNQLSVIVWPHQPSLPQPDCHTPN